MQHVHFTKLCIFIKRAIFKDAKMLSGINKGSFQLHLDRDIECACVFY